MDTIKKETVLGARAYAIGVKKRCRKIDRHSFKLGDFPLDSDRETIKAKAREAIEKNMKKITGKMTLGLTKETITDDGSGFISRSFMMFQDQEYIQL